MDIREKVAREGGRLKVFLQPDEVAILVDVLTWVRDDLELTHKQLSDLGGLTKSTLEKIPLPKGIFQSYDGILESARTSLLFHAVADCDEQGREETTDFLAKRIDARRQSSHVVRQFVRLVSSAAHDGQEPLSAPQPMLPKVRPGLSEAGVG